MSSVVQFSDSPVSALTSKVFVTQMTVNTTHHSILFVSATRIRGPAQVSVRKRRPVKEFLHIRQPCGAYRKRMENATFSEILTFTLSTALKMMFTGLLTTSLFSTTPHKVYLHP